jgi:hypothetical protein
MLTTRVQARLQPASRCRSSTACRSAVLSRVPMRVVAFKENDEQQSPQQQQETCKAKVTFQIPLHGKQPVSPLCLAALVSCLKLSSNASRPHAVLSCCRHVD